MKVKTKFRGSLRSAFSLIEMLVVIAVILLLARLLMPGVEKAKEQALIIQCGNNLHQLGVAFHLYFSDYGYVPANAVACQGHGKADWVAGATGGGAHGPSDPVLPLGCSPYSNPDYKKWSAIGQYANPSDRPCRKTVFWCPADIKLLPNFQVSYLMNAGLAEPNSDCPYQLIRYSQVKTPAATYLLWEEGGNAEGCPSCCGGDGNDGCMWSNGSDKTSCRHKGGTNMLYVDGHVKFHVKKSDVDSDMVNKRGMCYDVAVTGNCAGGVQHATIY